MVLNRVRGAVVAAAVLLPSIAHAQSGPCTSGPGSAFGVTSYNCTNCGVETKTPGRITYLFHAEPTVLSVDPSSALRVGDVVVAVNHVRVTTREGAELFASPPPGLATLTIRRGGKTIALPTPARPCGNAEAQGASGESSRPRPPVKEVITGKGVVTGHFGLGATCKPSCTRARASDGTYYWQFDGEPPVILMPGGPAERAGLLAGDRIVEVEGLSILTVPGAFALLRSSQRETLKVTVMRGQERLTFDLVSSKK